MADIQRIKGNIKKMIDGGAQEAEIDQYIASEGVSVDDLKSNYGLDDAQKPSFMESAMDTVGGGARRFLDGAFLGWGDELHGGVTALPRAAYNAYEGEGFDLVKGYEEGRDDWRGKSEAFQAENPVTGAVLEGGGGLTTAASMPFMNFAKAATLPAQMGKSAIAGGTVGGIYGAGDADGDLTDRAVGAGTGAGIGMVAGGAVPPLVKGVSKGAQVIKDNIVGRTAKGAGTTAQRKVIEALQRDGLSLRDAEARVASMGPEAALMDVGPNSQSLARAVYSQPGAGKAQVGEFLTSRQEGVREPVTKDLAGGQINRVTQAIDDLMPGDVRATRAATQAERSRMGGNYEAAKAGDDLVDVQPVLASLDDEIAKSKGGIKTALQKVRSYLVDEADNPEISVETLHQAKMAIDDLMSGEAKTSMGNVAKGRVRSYQDQLVEAIESAGEAGKKYKEGRLGTAAAWRIDEALDAGEQFMLKRAGSADDIADALKKMRPEEQEAFRQGAAQAIKSKLGDMNARTDVTKKLMDIPNLEAKIKTAFGSDEAFQKYIGNLENERAMFDSYGRIVGGSRTAEVAAEQADSAVDPGRVAEGVRQVAMPGGVTDMVRGAANIAGGLKNRVAIPAPVSEQLADILTGRYTSDMANMAGKTAIQDARRAGLAKLLTSGGAVTGGNVR